MALALARTADAKKKWVDPDEELAAAGAAAAARVLAQAGFDPAKAAEGGAAAAKAARRVSENKSVFGLREWTTKFSRLAGEGWLEHPKWGEFRGLLARSVGLIPLAEAQSDKDWSMWAPSSHVEAEKEMIELAKRDDPRHRITLAMAEAACDARPTMEKEQRDAAIASCVSDKAVVVTEGTAGAGKSYTLDAIKDVYLKAPPTRAGEAEGYQIVGAALSWTAAKVLQESAKLDEAQALQGLLIEMDKAKKAGGSYFKRRTLVVVDEAGLVGTMKMRALLRHAKEAPFPVRVLLTGDSLQLNPVEAGNALEAIVEACGSSRLDVIRRQERGSHKAAVKHFAAGRAEQGLWTYWQQEAVHVCGGPDERRERVMRDYVRIMAAHPMGSCLVLALENAEVKKLNQSMRERLKAVGLLAGEEHELEVNDGAGPYKARFCVGDRIVLRKNLREQPVFESSRGMHDASKDALAQGQRQDGAGLFSKMISAMAAGKGEPFGKEVRKGVFNRSAGIVLGIRRSPSGPGDRLVRMLLNEGGEVEIDTAALRQKVDERDGQGRDGGEAVDKAGIALHHNFATTIYASQGQTVDRVLLMDSPYMNRRLAYVGMSRHRKECEVYADARDLDARRRDRAKRDMDFTWSQREKQRCRQIMDAPWFPEGDLLAEMALAWNKESKNPTVTQALASMGEKRERAKKEGTVTGRLRQAPGDDPDDAEQALPPAAKPPAYQDLMAARAAVKPERKAGFFATLLGAKPEASEAAPIEIAEPAAEPLEMPAWAGEPLAVKSLADWEGMAWGRSRWGAPRLFALDKEGAKVARWSLDGRLAAGRGEPPVLVNCPESPWLVVAGPREAMLSWSHFQAKHAASPAKAPSIAVAFDGADLSALADWVPQGTALHCAWSPRDPASLDWAMRKRDELASLGFKAGVYPKPPAAGAAPKPKAAGPR